MAGKIGGLMTGIVINIDDPSGFNRVRVRIPAIHGTITEDFYGMCGNNASHLNRVADNAIPWAQVAFPFGERFTPELNQVVIVGFINGDEGSPVVLGWLGYEYASEEVPLQPNKSQNKG